MNEQRTYKYKIVVNEFDNEYKVVDGEDFPFSNGKSVKGAVIGALAIGIPLSQIDFNGNYVPLKEVFAVIK